MNKSFNALKEKKKESRLFEYVEHFAHLALLRGFRELGFFLNAGDFFTLEKLHTAFKVTSEASFFLKTCVEVFAKQKILNYMSKDTFVVSPVISSPDLLKNLNDLDRLKDQLIAQDKNLGPYIELIYILSINLRALLEGQLDLEKLTVITHYLNDEIITPSFSNKLRFILSRIFALTKNFNCLCVVDDDAEEYIRTLSSDSRNFHFYKAKEYHKNVTSDLDRHSAVLEKYSKINGKFDLIILQPQVLIYQNFDILLRHLREVLKIKGIILFNEYSYTDKTILDAVLSIIRYTLLVKKEGIERLVKEHTLLGASFREKLESKGFYNITIIPFRYKLAYDAVLLLTEKNKDIPQNCTETKPQLETHNTMDSSTSEESIIKGAIKDCLVDHLKLDRNLIEDDAPFAEYGLDSIRAVFIARSLNKKLNTALKKTSLYEYPTIASLNKFILKNFKVKDNEKRDAHVQQNVVVGNTPEHKDIFKENIEEKYKIKEDKDETEIAIIGMAGYFPGADNIFSFWENIRNGINSTSAFSDIKDRYDFEVFCKNHGIILEKSNPKISGFVNNIYKFDTDFFRISPSEAKHMDPQQRLLLEVEFQALEDAGYTISDLNNKKCGVFTGIGASDYSAFNTNETLSFYSMLGTNSAAASARISYFLNLKGPNISIDTACSSSLVAVHQACQSIVTGASDIAIVSGVSIMNTPTTYIMMSNMGMLSKSGRCNTFDRSADGVVPAESVATIILKPLSAAIRDNDNIYCVIKGSGVGYDGKSNGITAPNGNAQTKLEKEVYDKFNIDPNNISFVEAHGTGTMLGDPIEVAALANAFSSYTNKKQYCAIGSVKTNIGHALAASGIVGIIKTSMCLFHETIVPSLNFESVNTEINLSDSPFYVPTKVFDWTKTTSVKKQAAVSAFGFSGTNAHVVLEEFRQDKEKAFIDRGRRYFIVPISAKSHLSLEKYLKSFEVWLEMYKGSLTLSDLAYTYSCRKTHFTVRTAFCVSSIEELLFAVKNFNKGIENGFVQSVGAEPISNTNFSGLFSSEVEIDFYDRSLLSQIAEFYVAGNDVLWKKFFIKGVFYKIPVPPYAFIGSDYRLVSSTSRNVEGKKIKECNVGGNEYKKNLVPFSGVFQSSISDSLIFLKDHVVNGNITFPGVLYFEFIARGLLQGGGKIDVKSNVQQEFFNVTWYKVFNPECGERELFMRRAEFDNNKVEIVSVDEKSDKFTVYMSAEMGNSGFSKTERKKINFEQCKARCKEYIEPEVLYSRLFEQGIVHGRYYKVVKELWLGHDEVLGHLEFEKKLHRDFDNWDYYPALLDGGLQVVALLGTAESTKVPFCVTSLKKYNTLEKCTYVYAKKISEDKYDVVFYDMDGNLRLQFEGITYRGLIKNELDILYRPTWIKKEELSFKNIKFAVSDKVVLFICPSHNTELATYIKRHYSNENINFLILGDKTYQKSASVYEIDIDDIEAWKQTILMLPKVEHVYFFGDLYSSSSLSSINPLERLKITQLYGVISLFRFIKALYESSKLSQDIQLVVVSKNASLDDDSRYRPWGASLHGFTHVLAKECTHWDIRMFDIDEEEAMHNIDIADSILQAINIPLCNTGEVFAIRKNYLFERALYKTTLPKTENINFRDKGVYVIVGGASGIGFELSKHLAKTHQSRLVWIGRSKFDSTYADKLRNIENLGGKASYFTGNICKVEDVERVISKVRNLYGKVHGIVHSALSLNDKSIFNMSEAMFQETFDSKAIGSVIYG